MPRRADKIRRVIDQWEFHTDTSIHDQDRATFDIYLCRSGNVQEKVEGVRPTISFYAQIDSKKSSALFSAKSTFLSVLSAENEDIHGLRKKVQELFEEATAKDWRKIILVNLNKSDRRRAKFCLELDFAVCEKGGSLYRREDGWITKNAHDLCGDFGEATIELPYSQEMIEALEQLERNLTTLSDKLVQMVSDPQKFLTMARSALADKRLLLG